MKRILLITGILVGITHLPLLMMDGTYWDDWVLKQFILDGDFSGHFLLWEELGLPGYAYIYWAIGSLGNPVIAHNIVTFLLLIASSVLVWMIAEKMNLSPFESGVIAITSGVYACLETTFVFNVTVYLLMLTLFLAGVYVAFQKGWTARVFALLLLAISFQHNSLLVLYGGFLFLRLLKTGNIVTFFKTHIDYIVLPIVFWAAKETFTDTVDYYNRFNASFSNIKSGTLGFLSKGVIEQGREILREIQRFAVLWAAAVMAGGLLTWKYGFTLKKSKHTGLVIFGVGFILFLCAIAPYVLVSKGPRAHGYTTRHGLLIAIPIGVMIVGALRSLQRNAVGTYIASALLTTALLGSMLAHWSVYYRWQERWVKDRSVITYFADHPELKRIGTFIVEDMYQATSETYRYYEWSAMIRHAWGESGYLMIPEEESFEAITEIGEFHPHWKEWYHLEGYPHSSCEARIEITKGDANPLTYTRIRLFGDNKEMTAFLRNATAITVTPNPGC